MNTTKIEKMNWGGYASPSAECIELASEQVFATSGVTEQDFQWSEFEELV